MTGGIQNFASLPGIAPAGAAAHRGTEATESASGASFADTLKHRIDEVARLQQDASNAVDSAMIGGTDDVTGVMTAVEKADLAFKTLLAIRTKLMEAYDEVKNMQV
jgi:flagellar hook-basal body complex protein FliE